MIEFEERKKIRMHLDIAPLVDIVFLLLIFFMLTAHFIVQPGIEITLPTARAVELQEVGEIIISITEGNEIFLNDKWIDISELKYSLEEKLKLSSKKTVILKADERINLGLAVEVMDIAKQANVDNLIISTRLEHQSTRAPEYQ